MRRWLLAGLVLMMVLGQARPAAAFMSLEEYVTRRAEAAGDPAAKALLDAHIDGVASGLFTAAKDGDCKDDMFCQPPDSFLSLSAFYDFLDARVATYREAGIFDQVKDHSVALTILFELRRRFPCPPTF